MEEEIDLGILQKTYAFCRVLYSFPFKKRIEISLGTLMFDTYPNDEIKS